MLAEFGKKCFPVYKTLVDRYFFQANSRYWSDDKADTFVFLFKALLLYICVCVCIYNINR